MWHNEDPNAKPIICPADASGEWLDELEPLWRIEMQARNIGHCIQLSQRIVRMKTEELLQQMREDGWRREHRAYLLREIITRWRCSSERHLIFRSRAVDHTHMHAVHLAGVAADVASQREILDIVICQADFLHDFAAEAAFKGFAFVHVPPSPRPA